METLLLRTSLFLLHSISAARSPHFHTINADLSRGGCSVTQGAKRSYLERQREALGISLPESQQLRVLCASCAHDARCGWLMPRLRHTDRISQGCFSAQHLCSFEPVALLYCGKPVFIMK